MTRQWADDFHHSLRTLLTGEQDGYYADFGRVADLAKAFRRPFVYDGAYSHFRRRRFGAPAEDRAPAQFVVFSQNHDQVGNRAFGDRMPAAARPLAAFCVLLSPFTPLLFMGEEYGEQAPFQFFTDHIDDEIAEATREGRRTRVRAPSPVRRRDPRPAGRRDVRGLQAHAAARTRSCRPSTPSCCRPARLLPRASATDRVRRVRRAGCCVRRGGWQLVVQLRRLRGAGAVRGRGAGARHPSRGTAGERRGKAARAGGGAGADERSVLARPPVPARRHLGRRGDQLLALLRERASASSCACSTRTAPETPRSP